MEGMLPMKNSEINEEKENFELISVKSAKKLLR